VVVQDSEYVMTETIVGCKNVRRLCATYAGPTSGFEIIHGLVDRIMTLCEVAPEPEYVANSGKGDEEKFRVSREGWFYTIQGLDENDARARTYFPGRAAQVFLSKPSTGGLDNRVSIGTFGILHPEVLQNFDIQYPSSSVELNLEALL
jgi:phenylalanyl-tRNA synthetase beta chain